MRLSDLWSPPYSLFLMSNLSGSLIVAPPSLYIDKDVGEEPLLLIVVLACCKKVNWTELKKKFSQTVQFRTFVLILPSGTLMCSGEIGILVKQRIDVHVLCIIVIYNIEEIWPKFRKLLACSLFVENEKRDVSPKLITVLGQQLLQSKYEYWFSVST